jgi:hypothetical protein
MYINKNTFLESIEKQKLMNKHSLNFLYKKGIKDTNTLDVDFYFYSNEFEKLLNLSKELSILGHSLDDIEESDSESNEFVLTGTSPGVLMDETNLTTWTTDMCEIGFKYDCSFSGWEVEVPNR